jgi:urease accessory protein UreE
MARFLTLTMTDTLRRRQRTVHVNLDQIRIVLPDASGTIVMFDQDHSIVVEDAPDRIVVS